MPAGELPELDQWILLRAEDLVARCRAWYENFEFHKVYHTRLRLRDGRPQLGLLRCAERPAVHLGREIQSAAQRPDRALPPARRAGPPARAHHELHRGGGLDATWAQPAASIRRYFPEPAELTAGLDERVRKRADNWDRLMEVRGDVLKSLETARNEKLIGAPLEARVRLSVNGDLYPLLEQYAARAARPVHRVAGGSG